MIIQGRLLTGFGLNSLRWGGGSGIMWGLDSTAMRLWMRRLDHGPHLPFTTTAQVASNPFGDVWL